MRSSRDSAPASLIDHPISYPLCHRCPDISTKSPICPLPTALYACAQTPPSLILYPADPPTTFFDSTHHRYPAIHRNTQHSNAAVAPLSPTPVWTFERLQHPILTATASSGSYGFLTPIAHIPSRHHLTSPPKCRTLVTRGAQCLLPNPARFRTSALAAHLHIALSLFDIRLQKLHRLVPCRS